MQVTVGSKYQIVIPKEVREKITGFRPGSKVSVHALGKDAVTIKTDPKNWLEATRGIAKDAWKDIDTTKYLEDLRNDW